MAFLSTALSGRRLPLVSFFFRYQHLLQPLRRLQKSLILRRHLEHILHSAQQRLDKTPDAHFAHGQITVITNVAQMFGKTSLAAKIERLTQLTAIRSGGLHLVVDHYPSYQLPLTMRSDCGFLAIEHQAQRVQPPLDLPLDLIGGKVSRKSQVITITGIGDAPV